LMSYNLKMRNPSGVYNNLLGQDYFFYSPTPRKSVILIRVITKIDEFKFKKGMFHYYCGKDLSLFRFPDESLIKLGSQFSNRELEIINLISQCLSSEQIAEKLFISLNTVNTHRSNILEKSGKATISELIYELKEQGLL
jgi:DNA-binding CsgD family transcriptional regulator